MKIIKENKNKYKLTNVICKYITGSKKINLDELINHPLFDHQYHLSNLLIRLLSRPHICYYINKYLNDLYQFDKYPPDLFIESLKIICEQNKIEKKDLYYPAFKENQVNIVKLFDEYLNSRHITFYNTSDIANLLFLYNNGRITEQDLDEIKRFFNPEKTEEKKETIPFPTIRTIKSSNEIRNSEKIQELCQYIKNKLSEREVCKRCPLYQHKQVILETNVEDISPVDIIFIGVNPGKEEREQDRPFIGKSGQLLRKEIIDKLLAEFPNIKYVITNCILCSTDNETKIPKINQVISNCREIIHSIVKMFQPRYIALFGSQPLISFNIDTGDKITKINGAVINNNYIVSVHPSFAVRNANNIKYIHQTYETIRNLLSGLEVRNEATKNLSSELEIRHETIKNLSSEPEVKQITKQDEITENCILLDIKRFDEKVIFLFYDTVEKKKKYKIEDIRIPIYIKLGDYKDCNLIEDKVDYVSYFSYNERQKLMNLLLSKMKSTVSE